MSEIYNWLPVLPVEPFSVANVLCVWIGMSRLNLTTLGWPNVRIFSVFRPVPYCTDFWRIYFKMRKDNANSRHFKHWKTIYFYIKSWQIAQSVNWNVKHFGETMHTNKFWRNFISFFYGQIIFVVWYGTYDLNKNSLKVFDLVWTR